MKRIIKIAETILEGMLWTGLAVLALLLLFGWALSSSAYLSVLLIGMLLLFCPLLYVFVWIEIQDAKADRKNREDLR